MTRFTGPLYEISVVVVDAAQSELDTWLDELTCRAVREKGIEGAHVFDSGVDDEGRATRVCQFRATDDNAMDALLDGFFADVDGDIAEQFGERVVVSSQIMREDNSHDLAQTESLNCLNCGTRLRGQYCGNCGQRASNRLISLWELLREAFGDLLEIDSRVWRTLVPLLIRPGQLTHDYLQGRRARYMPPFRTYLVLSVIFFVVAFFDPREDLELLFEPEPEPTPEEIAERNAERAAKEKDILQDLADEGIYVGAAMSDEQKAELDDQIAAAMDDGGHGLTVSLDGDEEDFNCESQNLEFGDSPEWIKRRLTPERVKYLCEQYQERGLKVFTDALVDNIPVALIVLMPLMALVLKVLYPLSRRYFVEHLLFFVHFHAFFFLILTLQILFSRAAARLTIEGSITSLVLVAASIYIPVYLYKGMRSVYQQGYLMTFIKYIALFVAYCFGVLLTLLGAVLFAVVSI